MKDNKKTKIFLMKEDRHNDFNTYEDFKERTKQKIENLWSRFEENEYTFIEIEKEEVMYNCIDLVILNIEKSNQLNENLFDLLDSQETVWLVFDVYDDNLEFGILLDDYIVKGRNYEDNHLILDYGTSIIQWDK